MAQISPVLQYILSKGGSFNGPRQLPNFSLVGGFAQPGQLPQDSNGSLNAAPKELPSWLFTYLGNGDAARGQQIFDQISNQPAQGNY